MSLDKTKTLGRQLICLALLGLSGTAQAGENGWTSTGPDAVVNLVVPDESQQRLYAGSDRGIFTRDMNDSVWTVLAGGALAEHNVLSFAVDTTDARLYAGTELAVPGYRGGAGSDTFYCGALRKDKKESAPWDINDVPVAFPQNTFICASNDNECGRLDAS